MYNSGIELPKVSFSALDYTEIPGGGYFIGFDLDNSGKLSKMDDTGTISVIEQTSSGGTLTSVGLNMPAAFTVSNSPITLSGDIVVTGAGLASQYIRGDGTLASLPDISGGGGGQIYYFNGGISQGIIGVDPFEQMSTVANLGTGVDFVSGTVDSISFANFITDTGKPTQEIVPAGVWIFQCYMSASLNTCEVYATVEIYDGSNFTILSTSLHEVLTNGSTIDLYTFTCAVPEYAPLTPTDRVVVRFYPTSLGGSETITLHTQDIHLSSLQTTFTTGLSALNGLTASAQYLQVGTTGTDFNVASLGTDTHILNLPTADSVNRGALSSTDWTTFNGKVDAIRSISTTSPLQGGGDLSADRTFTIDQATGLTSGYLSSTDWNTFNNKQDALPALTANTLYVSPDGSDADLTRSTHIGRMNKPFLTLKAARDAAIAGDTIYVHPQTFIFDNRTTNGNYWNTRAADINLWKNGVNYYFSPGCKIIIYNQSVIGAELHLFRPKGTVFETCNIYGHLEFEQYCVGVDTTNGYIFFHWSQPSDATDIGYSTYIQVKSIYTASNNTIHIARQAAATGKATVTIYADSYIHDYVTGQSGWGTAMLIWGSDTGQMEYNQNIRYMKFLPGPSTYLFSGITIRGDLSYTSINIEGDTLIAPVTNVIFNIRPDAAVSTSRINGQGIINMNIKRIYFTGPAKNIGAVMHNLDSSSIPFIFNLKGDCIEYAQNGNAKTLFMISGANTASRVLNYEGNIYTITASGETTQSLYSQGRRIASLTGTGSVLNHKGDINYVGPLVTLREVFRTAVNGIINYTGNIKGNFGCPITKCNSGEINIRNSTIISDIDSSASSVIGNGFNYINSNGGLTGSFTTGKITITNSYIKLKNSSNYIGNGGYINAVISNSTIINSGTLGSGIRNEVTYFADPMTNAPTSNSTPTGTIQLINSSLIVDPASISLYYTNTTAISANSNTNAPWTVSTGLKGSIDLITELTA